MARDREDDDGYSNEPRRRDEDDRGRRRRDDDDDYDRPVRKKELSGLDKTFAETNIVVLILFSLLCNGIALILGVVGLLTCKDETAKKNAMIATIIGGIMGAIGVIVRIAASAAN